jgi:transposase-like protein
MSNKPNQSHSNVFKFSVALDALRGIKSVQELCKEFGLASSLVYEWKKQLEDNGPTLFVDKRRTENADKETIEKLARTLEKVEAENDFLGRVFNRLP